MTVPILQWGPMFIQYRAVFELSTPAGINTQRPARNHHLHRHTVSGDVHNDVLARITFHGLASEVEGVEDARAVIVSDLIASLEAGGSTASYFPVDAPEGTEARPNEPLEPIISTSTVGFPLESSISLALILDIVSNFHILQ